MTTITLHLSDELQKFLVGAVQSGNFESPAAYIEALLARTKNGQETLEVQALAGVESGECLPWNDELKNRLYKDVAERLSHG